MTLHERWWHDNPLPMGYNLQVFVLTNTSIELPIFWWKLIPHTPTSMPYRNLLKHFVSKWTKISHSCRLPFREPNGGDNIQSNSNPINGRYDFQINPQVINLNAFFSFMSLQIVIWNDMIWCDDVFGQKV
jgi:hypothetical protein